MTNNHQPSRLPNSNAKLSHKASHEQGMALLTILLLVVAITIVAGSMLASQKVMIREYELTKGQGQYKEYALAGESFAANLIAQDSQLNQVDSLKDSWAKPIPEQTIDHVKVSIKIEDDASLFNINNLYHDGKVDETAVAFFKALLQANGLSPNIAMAVLDWQDPDSNTNDGGAEADYYQSTGKKMAMNIANQPFISIDELQHVRGIDAEGFKKIKPYLTAVPYYLPMNVNTVQPELLSVVTTLPSQMQSNQNEQDQNPPNPNGNQPNQPNTPFSNPVTNVDGMAIANWANTRANNLPIQKLSDFWAMPSLAKIDATQQALIGKLLDTHSRSFHVFVAVKGEDKQLFLRSQIAKILPESPNNQIPASGTAPTLTPTASNNTPPQIIPYNRQFLP